MSRQHRPPARALPRRLGQAILVMAAVLAPLAAAAPALSAAGPGGPGIGGEFGLAPAPGSQGRAAPYFQLAVAPGHSATATVVVSNLGDKTQTLAIGRAAGVTATNGGSAYRPQFPACSGAGCWVTGLPRLVTLPAHAREMLNFTVSVPAGTARGQYLSGISAEPATRPRSVNVGSNGNASARAIIVEQVTVGVAVTVGDLSALVTRLQVPAVLGAIEGPVARLNIRLDNTGQTFAKGTGKASCTAAGERHSYNILAGTVLPRDHALIPVNVPGIPEGATVSCAIQIHYGKDQTVRWSGTVAIPAPPSARISRTGNGSYSEIPQGGIPAWAIALICIGVLLLAGIAVLLHRLYRPR